MKKMYRTFIAFLIVAMLAVSFTGCINVDDYSLDMGYEIDSESLELVGDTKLSYEFDDEVGEYAVMIEGYVKNITAAPKNYSSVAFVIYDADGNTIGLAETYCYYLEAGATWRMCAIGYAPYEPHSYKLVSLK